MSFSKVTSVQVVKAWNKWVLVWNDQKRRGPKAISRVWTSPSYGSKSLTPFLFWKLVKVYLLGLPIILRMVLLCPLVTLQSSLQCGCRRSPGIHFPVFAYFISFALLWFFVIGLSCSQSETLTFLILNPFPSPEEALVPLYFNFRGMLEIKHSWQLTLYEGSSSGLRAFSWEWCRGTCHASNWLINWKKKNHGKQGVIKNDSYMP